MEIISARSFRKYHSMLSQLLSSIFFDNQLIVTSTLKFRLCHLFSFIFQSLYFFEFLLKKIPKNFAFIHFFEY